MRHKHKNPLMLQAQTSISWVYAIGYCDMHPPSSCMVVHVNLQELNMRIFGLQVNLADMQTAAF